MNKVCIFGAGAVGGHMAAHLARAGVDVSVVARGDHLAAIRRDGLRFIGLDGEFTVRVAASDHPADLGPQDLVISTLKAHGLPPAASSMRALLGAGTPVVFAVNGIPWWYLATLNGGSPASRLDPEGTLAREVGLARALGCVIRSPNEVVAPGVVRSNSRTSSFLVGEPDGALSPRLEQAVALLRRGLPGAAPTRDIGREVWGKLLLNVPSSLLSSLTHSPSSALFADAATRELYARLARETCAVAARHGAAMAFDLDGQMAATGSNLHPPSMLQDLLAGRPLELDAQLFAVQDLARSAGVDTPMLDVMLALLAHRARA
ncbi:MAG: 2-dehydropantoate 2-reductase [Alcaligenaceae bacterium]|nr:2-dehydropantoate 2-reductase [Alcaligenaceae bacterium SAGV5]MPS52971.1 2-dehydropantoate 2-reductase [Alcaligenaceae bacterium SAGV3]MPT58893.1 2-dehydropantoate 2-reductase [Alcaligenaceae bacterium]